jgi:AraC family transcriptional regulator
MDARTSQETDRINSSSRTDDIHSSQQTDRIRFNPPDFVERRLVDWPGLQAEIVTAKERTPFDYRYRADRHLLIAAECSERDDGETVLEGLPKSTQRNLSRRLTLVPAGRELYGWQNPRVLARVNYFYIDPRGPLFAEEPGLAETTLRPRLLFFDEELWRISMALKSEALRSEGRPTRYGEALAVMLGHELSRLERGGASPAPPARGGLSGWQQKKVAEFIEEHLAEEVRLSTLSGLVNLSPYHFARAFKQSFGVPPHRYHTGRRIERAKALLAQPARSVTEIALALGFAETSSFSAAFRRMTGSSPSAFRRLLR